MTKPEIKAAMASGQLIFSHQYDIPCVVVEDDTRIDGAYLIMLCRQLGAVRHIDGEEFCVQLRNYVGPELWSEEALHRSLRSGNWEL